MSSSTAAPLGRQLTSAIDGEVVSTKLAITSILGDICREPSTSSSELHKFSLRINSLLHANQDPAKGFTLALLYVRNVPWDVVVTNATQWISAALTHFSLARKESILLLNQLLGRDAIPRLEYWRSVASNGVNKYATSLIEALENMKDIDDETMALTLQALSTQIRLYPSVYRSQAAQLNQICSEMLVQRPTLATQITILLAALHCTGKGPLIQAQLWTSTLELLVKDAQLAWKACASSFQSKDKEEDVSGNGLLPNLSQDGMEAFEQGSHRLRLLLGSPPNAGVVSIFLSESTQHAVPIPLDRLVNFALKILSTTSASTHRQDFTPEATLLARQSALLPSYHSSALTFLATLPISIIFAKRNKVMNRVLRVIEKSCSPIRCIAFHTLVILNIKLDPEKHTVLRCARTCLAQISRLLKYTSTSTTSSRDSNGMKERSKKRRKIFESDQIQFAKRNGFTNLDEDDYAACIAAVKLLSGVYEALATHLSAEHYDLAQTSALVLLGLTEISLQDPDALSAGCLQAMAEVIRLSRGSILSLMTTKSAALASQGAQSDHHDTREAATLVLQALEYTFHPRMPLKLDLRLHVDNDDSKATNDEEPVLGKVELHEDRGSQAIEAMRDVLYVERESSFTNGIDGHVQSLITRPTSPLAESPKRSTPRPSLQLSPDPVKPLHRPSTPRIGSPSLSHAAPASTMSITTSADNGTIISSTIVDKTNLNTQQPLFGVASVKSNQGSASPSDNRINTMQSARPSSPLARDNDEGSMLSLDDSDDEPLPEIDMRSSDEEDGEPIEEQAGDDVNEMMIMH